MEKHREGWCVEREKKKSISFLQIRKNASDTQRTYFTHFHNFNPIFFSHAKCHKFHVFKKFLSTNNLFVVRTKFM